MPFISFPIGRGWLNGVIDSVQVDPAGIVRLVGWRRGTKDESPAAPVVRLDGETIPFLQAFRYPRHDVEAGPQVGSGQIGLTLEYLVPERLPGPFQVLSIVLNEGDQPLRFQAELHFVGAHYRTLLNTETVLHRADIYGSGPPNSAVHPEVLELAKLLKPPVLDFGCGRGALTHALRRLGVEAYGLEMDSPMIREAIAADTSGIITLYDGAFPTPFQDGQFRSLICSEVLEHIPDYEAALAEMARVTRELAIFTVPDASAIPLGFNYGAVPWHLLEGTHVNFFTQQSLQRALAGHFSRLEFGRVGLAHFNGSPYYVSLAAVCSR